MEGPYQVKAVKVLASTPDVLVREFVFAPGEATPWHRHSAVSDRTYVLSGAVCVETRGPDAWADLAAGDEHLVPAGVVHRTVNRSAGDARYVLVQHGGRYDFLAEPGDEARGGED